MLKLFMLFIYFAFEDLIKVIIFIIWVFLALNKEKCGDVKVIMLLFD